PNDGEIMRNEDEREAEALLEIAKQVDHLRLDRDVERRDGLVAYDEAWLDRERARDADALPLATRKLVRITPCMRRCEPDLLHDFRDALGPPTLREAMQSERFPEHLADRHPRIKRRERILEADLQRATMHAHRFLAQRRHVLAIEFDAARGRLEQAQHEATGRRLAASGFADERKRLANRKLEVDPIDRAHQPACPPEKSL